MIGMSQYQSSRLLIRRLDIGSRTKGGAIGGDLLARVKSGEEQGIDRLDILLGFGLA